MCGESLVRHLLASWIHKYPESSLRRPAVVREQNCSQMLRDWPLSAKIAKHDPQMRSFPFFFLFLFSFYLSALRVVPRVLSSTCWISQLHGGGGFENCAQLNVTNPLTNCLLTWNEPFCIRDLPKSPGESYAKQIDHFLTRRDFVLRGKTGTSPPPPKKEQNNENKSTSVHASCFLSYRDAAEAQSQMYTSTWGTHTVLLLFINLPDRGLSGGQGRLPPEILRKCLISPPWLTSGFRLRKTSSAESHKIIHCLVLSLTPAYKSVTVQMVIFLISLPNKSSRLSAGVMGAVIDRGDMVGGTWSAISNDEASSTSACD